MRLPLTSLYEKKRFPNFAQTYPGSDNLFLIQLIPPLSFSMIGHIYQAEMAITAMYTTNAIAIVTPRYRFISL